MGNIYGLVPKELNPYLSPFPHRWQDDTVAILASGPTLCAEDIGKLQGKCKIIAVNDAYRLCPWADVLYAADWKWWQAHDFVDGYKGERWTQSIATPLREAHSRGLKIINGVRTVQLPDDRETLYTGNNGAFQALMLAVMSGSKRIILLGVDMQVIDGMTHFFGDHPKTLKQTNNFGIFRECFRKVRRELELKGIEAVNCSPRTTLNCFRKSRIEDVI